MAWFFCFPAKELIRRKRLKIWFFFCSKVDRNKRPFAKNRADGSNARLYAAITRSSPETLFSPPKNLHRHCFRHLLGHFHVPGEIENNGYAKVLGVIEVYYGIVQVQ